MPDFFHIPSGRLEEIRESRTTIARAYSGEQRMATRRAPREFLRFPVYLQDGSYARLAALVRKGYASDWRVPFWPDAVFTGAALSSGASSVSLDTSYSDFRSGDEVLVYENDLLNEVQTLSAVNSGDLEFVGTLSNDYERAVVAPLRTARVASPFQVEIRRVGFARVLVHFLMHSPSVNPIWSPSITHGGYGVFTEPFDVQGVADRLQYDLEYIDNLTGLSGVYQRSGAASNRYGFMSVRMGDAGRWALRGVSNYLDGSLRAVWVPSKERDVVLAASLGSSATTVNVVPLTSDPADSDGLSVLFDGDTPRTLSNGSVVSPSVHSYDITAVGKALEDGSSHDLMSLCRSESDSINFTHDGQRHVLSTTLVEVYE